MPVDLHHQPFVTDLGAISLHGLPDSLRAFCHAPLQYRQQHLQKCYGVAFDGYSYPGQEDSLNQGAEDQLHSFVFSDFSPLQRYPEEFHGYIQQYWSSLCAQVQQLEQELLKAMGLSAIAEQHALMFGHMMSANYFPARIQQLPPADLRLSAHPDVSLLTVFLPGIGEDFQYQDAAGQWRNATTSGRVTVFAGELLEWLTDGAIPALNHRVKHSEKPAERFSFALFSLPMPGVELTSLGGRKITTEDWYQLHLSQWDD